jgi:hypothetical protein
MSVQVAQIIHSQISRQILMAIGAKNYVAGSNSLQFDVSLFGSKKAKIVVKLNAADLYDVSLWNGRTIAKKAQMKDVFCEDLTNIVEGLAEANFRGPFAIKSLKAIGFEIF